MDALLVSVLVTLLDIHVHTWKTYEVHDCSPHEVHDRAPNSVFEGHDCTPINRYKDLKISIKDKYARCNRQIVIFTTSLPELIGEQYHLQNENNSREFIAPFRLVLYGIELLRSTNP